MWINQLSKIPLAKDKPRNYSQFGEEPLWDYIFKNIGTHNKFLVDFGAGGLGCQMSNSRYLLNNGWKGLLMDGEGDPNKDIKKEFITQENIVELFKKYNVPVEFDFLTIDIDGNDYWVLKKILRYYAPRFICAEFNGTIKPGISKTIKYNQKHTWQNNDYYGFSFDAGVKLGNMFDYAVVFQLYSTNMYFIRKDLINWQNNFNVSYKPVQYHPHEATKQWVEV